MGVAHFAERFRRFYQSKVVILFAVNSIVPITVAWRTSFLFCLKKKRSIFFYLGISDDGRILYNFDKIAMTLYMSAPQKRYR